jgi:putative membrane-bound dehydrogenase-like protein
MNTSRPYGWLIVALLAASWRLTLANAVEPPPPGDGPLTPRQALAAFQLEPGLSIELVAAEPDVESPVALAFDDRGRLFVAENRGYPTGPGTGEPPAGRIVLLEDLDGDGYFERRTHFAQGLSYPNGLMPWNGGLIVTCAPEILYLKDTDGDGQADLREVLFTGFSTAGSTQLRVSHPVLGIDNWVYLTSGLTGGSVTSPRHPDRAAIELRRTDFRFQPGGAAYEAADGGAQFGQSFDDWGHRFICYNRVQVQHVVISSKILKRNPHLAFSETVQNCPAVTVPEPLKGHGAGARLYPISSNVTTADSHAGTFTAACAVTIFRGIGLPDHYRGGALTCDPTGNLIHFDKLETQGATFSADRVREGIEFVASSDNWFRPVYLAHGPDGALYVCDMYRKTIEHPDYLPAEVRKHTDFEGGKGMGRLYRIVRQGLSPETWKARRSVDLSRRSTAELCRLLGDPDTWQRTTAQRLLLERNDPAAEQFLVAGLTGNGWAAIHSLRLLESFGKLTPRQILDGLNHSEAGVREAAVETAFPFLANSPELADPILRLADDANPRVRFQVAIACGQFTHPQSIPTLVKILIHDGNDRWLRAAVFSSILNNELAFLNELMARPSAAVSNLELYYELGKLLGASQPQDRWSKLTEQILGNPQWNFSAMASLLTGFADAIRNRGLGRNHRSTFAAFLPADPEANRFLREKFDEILSTAVALALDDGQSAANRQAALGLLAHAEFETSGQRLFDLVTPDQPAPIQAGAVRALGAMTDPRIAARLLTGEHFAAYTPALREEVLSALLSSPQHAPGIVAALENGDLPPNAIDALRRKSLLENRDPQIRERAVKVFASTQSGDRAKVYDEHKSLLTLSPDSENGRAVFKKHCSICHRLDRDGVPVGPDLFGIRNQPKEAILLHILIPEAEITSGFSAYVVETRAGRVVSGLLSSETSNSVTLKQQLGKEETILRSDIESLVASPQSLMPQGFEKSMTRQDLADLVSYLKGEKTTR